MGNKRVNQQIRKAKGAGMSTVQVAQMRAIAKKEADKMAEEAERIATERAFLFMLAIPLNILVYDYWQKSAKKRMPEFIEKVLSLYDSVEKGVVTDQELADLLSEYGGIDFKAEWLRAKGEK